MDREERIIFAGLIGMLLLEDRVFTNDERSFLEALLLELDIVDARDDVYVYARKDAEQVRGDIEKLRRSGYSDALLLKLREAALSDGEVQAEESALIDSVEEVIRLRLGAERYPVPLEGLNQEPVEELYELEKQLGRGGFGVVVRARDPRTGQRVVIKRLWLEIHHDISAKKRHEFEDRFWREVAILGTLRSPYSVRLLGAGFDTDVPYMVLEYIEGRTLRQALKVDGPLLEEQVRRLMLHILHAIADAHSKGVIHRDLKPENIMLSGHGSLQVARVLDFGLAGIMRDLSEMGHVTVTRSGDAVGTASYMPPEQIQELHVGRPQNDVYALGLLMMECLTGETTVRGTLRQVVKWQISEDPIPIPEFVRASPLGEIVEKAVSKDWQSRYPSAMEMLEAFESLPQDPASSAPRRRVWTRLWSGFKSMVKGES